jgi:diguanylate cyclase (GGDEF)-like protein
VGPHRADNPDVLIPRPAKLSVTLRTLFLCGGLWLAATALTLGRSGGPEITGTGSSLPLLALLFLLGGLLVFHVEFRDAAHSFTLTEVPMVLGLFMVSPAQLIAARLVGEALALLLVPRQPWLKFTLNASLWWAECAVALAVMGLFGFPPASEPIAWLAALFAVACADLLSIAVVHVVIRWHGAEPTLAAVLVAAAATSAANGSLGLVAVLLLQVNPWTSLILGVLAAVLFAGYRGYAGLQQRYASLQLLHDFSESIGNATRPEEVIEAMLHHARKLLRADVADLVVLTDGAAPDVRVTLSGTAPAATGEPGPLRSLLGKTARQGLPTIAPRHAVPDELAPYLEQLAARDALLVPLALRDGSHGVLAVANRLGEVSTFDDEDATLFATLASHASMALEKGRLIDELRHEASRREFQAMHDDLTGLPNRLHFRERADAAIAVCSGSRRLAVVLMDLDGFKEVNDTLGHHTGDQLLEEVGRRLTRVVRGSDIAARLGGDEFALLLDLGDIPGDAVADAALAAAGRVLRAVEEPVRLHGIDLDVRASTGLAIWPDDGLVASDLLQRADVAMYSAKSGKTGVVAYSREHDHNSPRRLQLAADLRRAIDDEQLAVHYQPKADMHTGDIVGAEALLRWRHPEHGVVSPDEFIPVAEQTGLITQLTFFVLEQGLRDCAAWLADGHDVGIAVNVSVRSLLEAGFADHVLMLLARTGARGCQLTLELTESSIMSDTGRTLPVLRRLDEAGVRLSVDDFGTGYSSLAYLQRLPVHELKVDRSFVLDVGSSESDLAIVRSVVNLGHSLGLTVVAEGVETQLVWDHLLDAGCDVVQGYFLSRPVAAAAMRTWLSVRASRRSRVEAVAAS